MNLRTKVQALRASVVGASPLPDVLVDEWQDVGLSLSGWFCWYMVLYGRSVNAMSRTKVLYGLSVIT